ncbi:MAG: succinyl-diaminopimelate desuccinylase [Thermoprotei archaeon]|nr:MAG: succinyl-diaminopimelate desuccinylase [Thermoprotei archaeon]
MISRLLETLEGYREWALKVLSEMVSIPTVNPPGDKYEEFVEYAERVFRDLNMDVETFQVPKGYVAKHYPDYAEYPRYVVVGRMGSGKPVVQFNGHYDVVPPGSGWSRDPFKPLIEGGKLYGRGAVDMKGGIASILLAIKAFTETIESFQGSLEVALVPDEEIGGATGTGYLVEERVSKPDYAVIAEPSGVNSVWIGHKGAFWAFVEIYGRQAHGSTPWKGINAFEYMVRVAQRFMEDYKRLIERKSSYYEYEDPEGAKPTVTIGGEVRGGAKVNIVPGYYAFSIDRRVIPEESLEEVEKEFLEFVEELAREFREVRVKAKVRNKLPPAFTDPNSVLVRRMVEAVSEVTGRKPRLTVCLGGLDMHYYTEKGISAITYGPGPMDKAHISDEYVSIDELIKASKAYAILLYKLLARST